MVVKLQGALLIPSFRVEEVQEVHTYIVLVLSNLNLIIINLIDSKEPEWTFWNRSLGEEETVHKYLNDNFMARFIPKRFTWN